MRKKNLVKCVFNFGSMRQDVGMANQIAEQCLHHWLYFEKDFDTNLKGPREGQSVRHSASDQ